MINLKKDSVKQVGEILKASEVEIQGLEIRENIITIKNDKIELTLIKENDRFLLSGYDVLPLGDAVHNYKYSNYSVTPEGIAQEIESIILNLKGDVEKMENKIVRATMRNIGEIDFKDLIADDEIAVHEAVLVIENDSKCYEQAKLIAKNLGKKMKNGTYDDNLAVKAYVHLVKSWMNSRNGFPLSVNDRIIVAWGLQSEYDSMVLEYSEHLNKKEVEAMFKEAIEGMDKSDKIALREAWNNFTDSLCKDGKISEDSYNNWISPAYCR